MQGDAAVLVCTCRRPHLLAALLDRLEELALQHGSKALRVVVVDDDPNGSAAGVAGGQALPDAGTARSLDVRYVHLGAENISDARNAAAANAGDVDWLFMIDDDCLPGPSWMDELLAVEASTGADIVCGPVRYVPADGAPAWLTEQGFLEVNHYPDGSDPTYGTFANALVRASWWREHPEVRFRHRYGMCGGEDLVLTIDARRAGAVIRWSERSEVIEHVPPERATMRYQLRRAFWTGNVNVVLEIDCAVRTRRRSALRVVRRVADLWMQTLVGLMHGRPHARRRTRELSYITGALLAIVGIEVNHR